jgi:hypothetical protein
MKRLWQNFHYDTQDNENFAIACPDLSGVSSSR